MKKNIIYIDPFAMKYKLNLEYYHGFVNALKKIHNVFIVNDLNIKNIDDIIDKFTKPDLIIFGLATSKQGYINKFYDRTINGLAELNIPKICFVLWYFNLQPKIDWMIKHKITHIFTEYYKAHELFNKTNIPTHRLLFATNSNNVPINETKQYDLCIIGALHEPKYDGNEYNLRRKIIDIIETTDIKKNILINKRYPVNDYYKLIGKTKIWLCTTSIPHGTISPRFYEIAKGKCLIFCDEWDDTYDGIFQDGINCVMFKNDLSDFQEKLLYYLKHDDERNKIINKAYDDVVNKHLWDNRVQEVFDIIEQ